MKVALGSYHLRIATEFGPRITSLRLEDGPELFASLGEEATVRHPTGLFHFRGGHRLWAAPENPTLTYAPDDHVCTVTENESGVTVSAPMDAAGLRKTIRVVAVDDGLVVYHEIVSDLPTRLAPWAITQLPLGGVAILPLRIGEFERTASGFLVLWPYSSLEDPRVAFRGEALVLTATDGPQIKFGSGPDPESLGYFRDGLVFIKEIEAGDGRPIPDFGAAGQVYLGQGFCELESVGAIEDLSENGGAVLTERWRVLECVDLDSAVDLTLGI